MKRESIYLLLVLGIVAVVAGLCGGCQTAGIRSDNFPPGVPCVEARAEAVKRYLNIKGGIPLHRMSTISYGESEPIADKHVKAGRIQNRRVVLVVIQ